MMRVFAVEGRAYWLAVVMVLLMMAITGCEEGDNRYKTKFFTAVVHRDYATVQDMVKKDKTLVQATRFNGDGTALDMAVQANDLPMVKLLIAAGSDLNDEQSINEPPLAWACYYRQREIVRELIKAGVDVSRKYRGHNYPLYAAASGGDIEIVKMLVDAGADVNAVDTHHGCGNSLVGALRSNPNNPRGEEEERQIVEYLIEHRADPQLVGPGGKTPLDWAIEWKAPADVIDMLRSVGKGSAGQ